MSAALYLVAEREIPGFDPFVNGKALSKGQKALDRLVNEAGVRPLMDFFSVDPAEAAGFLEDHDVEGVEIPAEQWFAADDGLKTVRALLTKLDAAPDTKNAAELRADLEEFVAVLERFAAEGVRFHCGVDY